LLRLDGVHVWHNLFLVAFVWRESCLGRYGLPSLAPFLNTYILGRSTSSPSGDRLRGFFHVHDFGFAVLGIIRCEKVACLLVVTIFEWRGPRRVRRSRCDSSLFIFSWNRPAKTPGGRILNCWSTWFLGSGRSGAWMRGTPTDLWNSALARDQGM